MAKKPKETPLPELYEYNRLNNQHKTSISNYRWFMENNNATGAKIMLDSIRGAEKKLESLAERYNLPPVIEFNLK